MIFCAHLQLFFHKTVLNLVLQLGTLINDYNPDSYINSALLASASKNLKIALWSVYPPDAAMARCLRIASGLSFGRHSVDLVSR